MKLANPLCVAACGLVAFTTTPTTRAGGPDPVGFPTVTSESTFNHAANEAMNNNIAQCTTHGKVTVDVTIDPIKIGFSQAAPPVRIILWHPMVGITKPVAETSGASPLHLEFSQWGGNAMSFMVGLDPGKSKPLAFNGKVKITCSQWKPTPILDRVKVGGVALSDPWAWPGTTVVFEGYNLKDVNKVLFNATPGEVVSTTDTTATVKLPPAAINGIVEVMFSNGHASGKFKNFYVGARPPLVDSAVGVANPGKSLLTAGWNVTLTGSFFMPKPETKPIVRINGTDVKIEQATDTKITFFLPKSSYPDGTYKLSVLASNYERYANLQLGGLAAPTAAPKAKPGLLPK